MQDKSKATNKEIQVQYSDRFTLAYQLVRFQMYVSPCESLLAGKVVLGWIYLRTLPFYYLQIMTTLTPYNLTSCSFTSDRILGRTADNKSSPYPNSTQRGCNVRSTHILEPHTRWTQKVIFKLSQFYISWESKVVCWVGVQWTRNSFRMFPWRMKFRSEISSWYWL